MCVPTFHDPFPADCAAHAQLRGRSHAPSLEAPKSPAAPSGGRTLKLLAPACAVAVAMFWGVMLTAPPTTEAARSSAPGEAACQAAAQALGPRLEAERGRRAMLGQARRDDFNLVLTWFEAAQRQCASGLVDRATANFRAIGGMLTRLELRPPGDDGAVQE